MSSNKGSISFLVEAAVSAESIPEGGKVIEPKEGTWKDKKGPVPWFMSPKFNGRLRNRSMNLKPNHQFYVPLHLVQRMLQDREAKENQDLAAATKEIILLKKHISSLQKNSPSKREFRNANACSEHKKKHQRCPSNCPTRKRSKSKAFISDSSEDTDFEDSY